MKILKDFYHNKILEKIKDHLRWNLDFMLCYVTCLSACSLSWKRNTLNSWERSSSLERIKSRPNHHYPTLSFTCGKGYYRSIKNPLYEKIIRYHAHKFLYLLTIQEESCTYSKRWWKIIVYLIFYEGKRAKIISFSNLNLGTQIVKI